MAMETMVQKNVQTWLKRASIGLLAAPFSLLNAAPLSLGTAPLFLGTGVDSNIILTLDDSGSMHWENMPGGTGPAYLFPRAAGIYGAGDYANRVTEFSSTLAYSVRNRTSSVNRMYYDPSITYVPWESATGSMGNVAINCAPHNPFVPASGCRDLTANNTQQAEWESWNGPGTPGMIRTAANVSRTFWPAVYYRFNLTGSPTWNVANYTQVLITPTVSSYVGGPQRTDCGATPTTCTYNQEIQNFANWYSYYRSRVLTSRAGIGRAFANQSTNVRVGFAAINVGSNAIDGVTSARAMVRGVRPFSGVDRATFYNDLYGHVLPPAGTPLRTALQGVGSYFERADNNGPWSEDPGANNATSHLACRQSFNILMTDGYYNGPATGVGDVDSTTGAMITGPTPTLPYTYTATPPYSDGFSDTLADGAMDYWVRDLRPTLANRVPTNAIDEAFWQHMVTFTVGLGVNGTLDPAVALPGLQSGATAWPDPSTSAQRKIDDLWHAGLNSRGGFFSAANPNNFATALGAILADISGRNSSSSSTAAVNSGSISSNTLVFQSRFNSVHWTGQLSAYPIDAGGTLGTEEWEVSSLIPTPNARVIITHDGVSPQRFRWPDLAAAQQTQLKASQVVDYIRGDTGFEEQNISAANKTLLSSLALPADGFRDRVNDLGNSVVLGDLVHSSPVYVGGADYRYPDALEVVSYSSFLASQRLLNSGTGRRPVVYIGGNDGMLHAFDARHKVDGGGPELFAYVPNSIYNKLLNHADPQGNHQYTVDGSPTVGDAFVGGSWKTILVSGLGAGGQGFFALDVTDPGAFSTETAAKSKVLWEFTDKDVNPSSANLNFDSDLGYTFGKASIVRLHNGKWAAVFGNGYNNTFDNEGDGVSNDSTTGNAVLYIVDLETGQLIKKIDTGEGSLADLSGSNYPNGLSEPTLIDIDNDGVIDYAYAGDLQGNLWKFDLTSNTAASWGVAHSAPLYKACASKNCTASTFQPITAPLKVKYHPDSGVMIYFGTGKYFETGDNTAIGQTTQTFYGIWDKNVATFTAFTRSTLLKQKIIKELGSTFASGVTNEVRVTTDNVIDWNVHNGWYLDLVNTGGAGKKNLGERQVSSAVLRDGRVLFNTLLPGDSDPCTPGGSSWFMVLDVFSGARFPYAAIDFSEDGKFDDDDFVKVASADVPGSGKKSKIGISSTPGVVVDGKGDLVILQNGSGGVNGKTQGKDSVKGGEHSPGRESWRQLDN